jgi:uncharacterized protein (TIGR03435 family)
MKKLLLSMLALAALNAGALFAQTFTGTWQGALKIPQAPNGELRTVIKISTTEADKLGAQLYSIDQNPTPIPANEVTTSGSTLKMIFRTINATYEGRLSADGNTLAGMMTQGEARPLNLTRATPATAWNIPEPPPPPKMMDPNAKPEFEVATVKPSDPNQPGWGINVNRSGKFTTHNTTLADLIKFAYDLHPKQVIGAPAWFDSDKFDIEGKPDTPGLPSVTQMRAMLQKLLVERFSLKFRKDQKELSAYAITVSKGGEKIRKEENAPVPVPGFGGRPQNGFNVRNATMAEFASVMQAQFMDQPVVDQTGLGNTRYTFVVKFTPDATMHPFGSGSAPPQPPQPAAPDPDAPPDLYSAMEQQLGLRMQKTKAPVEVMVIEKVEKPSAN